MALIILLIGLLGLIGISSSLSLLSDLIIGLTILFLPVRSMFLAIVVRYGWMLILLMTSSMISKGFGGAVCISPVFAIITVIAITLFFKYKDVEIRYKESITAGKPGTISKERRAAQNLPWMALFSGSISLLCLVASFIFAIGFVSQMFQFQNFGWDLENLFLLTVTLAFALALLGIAFGLSSLVDNRRNMAISIIGMICSGIVLIFWLGSIFLSWLALDQFPTGNITWY
jgi:hypothetical protein